MTEPTNLSAYRTAVLSALHAPFLSKSGSFTRPANTTAYAAGDRVCGTTTAVLEITDLLRADGEAVRIDRLRLVKSGNVLTNAQFKVHLFRTLAVSAVADNGAFNAAGALGVDDVAGHIGSASITMDFGGTASARGDSEDELGMLCVGAGVAGHETSVWAIVEALAAYTPASAEIFTLHVEASRI